MEYPNNYVATGSCHGPRDGEVVTVRPARTEDIPALTAYVTAMSPEERRLRYMSTMTAAARIKEFSYVYGEALDYDTHMVFLVENAAREIVGVVHACGPCTNESGFYEVSYSRDLRYRGAGVGTLLMQTVIAWGKDRGLRGFYADTLRENTRMQDLFKKFAFGRVAVHPDGDFSCFRYRLPF